MRLARAALDANNPDEAHTFFTRALEAQPENHDAWLGKAEAAGFASTIRNPRSDEVEAGIREAIATAPAELADAVVERGAKIITRHADSLFAACLDHFREFAATDSAWPDMVEHAIDTIGLLQAARKLNPSDPAPVRATIEVCHELLGGQQYYAEFDEHPGQRWYRVAPQTAAYLQPILAENVAEMARLDPSYEAPVLRQPAAMSSRQVAIVVALALVAVVGFIACVR